MHVKHDKHGCLHGGGHLQFLYMHILALQMCVCVHTCGGIWGALPDTLTPTATHSHNHKSQGAKITKHATKLEHNQDNLISFEDLGPVHFPALT